MISQMRENDFSELERTDWDFTQENGGSGLAVFHWYPARFIPSLPGILINYFSDPGDTVLDPFCGCGTTLVEAYKFGRKAIGIDLNPIAAMISRAKLIPFDQNMFSNYLDRILKTTDVLFSESLGKDLLDPDAELLVPNYEENRYWYHPDTLRELASLWTAIHKLPDNNRYIDVALTSFSAILKVSCSQNKHWGWVCDNCKPEVLVPKNAVRKFSDKMNQYKTAAIILKREVADLQEKQIPLTDFKVYQGDCARVLNNMAEGIYDLVVTSPPYAGTTDYIKAQRLSLLWFDYSKDKFLEDEIGARYKRARRNFINEYLRDMEKAFLEIKRTLKKGGYCCVIIGESPKREPTVNSFKNLLEELGFEPDKSLLRKVARQRRLFPVVKDERIIILRNK
jgi:SAM-dependent methyltransferase